jgi:hypothetical protein
VIGIVEGLCITDRHETVQERGQRAVLSKRL